LAFRGYIRVQTALIRSRLATGATGFGSSGCGLLVSIGTLALDSSVAGRPGPVLEMRTMSERAAISHLATDTTLSRVNSTYTSIPLSNAYSTALICSSLSLSRMDDPRLFKLGMRSMASMARLNRSALFLIASSSGVSMFPFSLYPRTWMLRDPARL